MCKWVLLGSVSKYQHAYYLPTDLQELVHMYCHEAVQTDMYSACKINVFGTIIAQAAMTRLSRPLRSQFLHIAKRRRSTQDVIMRVPGGTSQAVARGVLGVIGGGGDQAAVIMRVPEETGQAVARGALGV